MDEPACVNVGFVVRRQDWPSGDGHAQSANSPESDGAAVLTNDEVFVATTCDRNRSVVNSRSSTRAGATTASSALLLALAERPGGAEFDGVEITLNTYAHVLPDMQKQAAATIGGVIARLETPV